MSTIGIKIKKMRENKKLSLAELSQLSGVGKSTISEIENGKALNPKIETLSKLSSVLEVSVNDLLNTEEKLERANNIINDVLKISKEAFSKDNSNLENSIFSIASKFDKETFTKEEQEEITNFINYVISKRK